MFIPWESYIINVGLTCIDSEPSHCKNQCSRGDGISLLIGLSDATNARIEIHSHFTFHLLVLPGILSCSCHRKASYFYFLFTVFHLTLSSRFFYHNKVSYSVILVNGYSKQPAPLDDVMAMMKMTMTAIH